MAETQAGLATCALLVNGNDELFMLRRQNTNWMNGKWSIPGGMMEQGESPQAALVREVQEEAGVAIRPEDCRFLKVIHMLGQEQDMVTFYFVCRQWQGVPANKEKHKASEAGWFPLRDLPRDAIPHIYKLAKIVVGGGDSFESLA